MSAEINIPPPDRPRGKPQRGTIALVFALLIAIIIAALMVRWAADSVHSLVTAPGRAVRDTVQSATEVASNIVESLTSLLHVEPEVRIGSHLVHQPSKPVAELALIRRNFPMEYFWEHKIFGSTKRLDIQAVFVAKAGLNLERSIRVDIDETQKRIFVQLPRPTVLSIEMQDIKFSSKSGLWNRLSDEDRNVVLSAFNEEAQKRIHDSRLIDEAELEIESKLKDIAAPLGWIITSGYFLDETSEQSNQINREQDINPPSHAPLDASP